MVMQEIIRKAEIAHGPGVKFSCANIPNPCPECMQNNLAFITKDAVKAAEHSGRNSVAMWIVVM